GQAHRRTAPARPGMEPPVARARPDAARMRAGMHSVGKGWTSAGSNVDNPPLFRAGASCSTGSTGPGADLPHPRNARKPNARAGQGGLSPELRLVHPTTATGI